MKTAYVDTSILLAVLLGEPSETKSRKRLAGFDRLLSSAFMEAELRSAFRREEVDEDPAELWEMITWIHPDRRLTEEMSRALGSGYVRGADLWHLATALYVDPTAEELVFLTLDERQRTIAEQLGFAT